MDIVAGVSDGVDNGPDAAAVIIGCDSLSLKGLRILSDK